MLDHTHLDAERRRLAILKYGGRISDEERAKLFLIDRLRTARKDRIYFENLTDREIEILSTPVPEDQDN